MVNFFVPIVDHISLRVVDGALRTSNSFMQDVLGWQVDVNRNPKWNTGESLFFNRSNGDISIQLTVETGDVPGEVTDSFHLALATPSVHAVMVRLETFCHQYDVKMVSEDLGQGKLMVKIPDVFYGAFEFVPYHSF